MGMPKIPTAEETRPLNYIPPKTLEMLEYCMDVAIECGDMFYDSEHDELTYYLRVRDFDRDLFDLLKGTEEIWITTRAKRES